MNLEDRVALVTGGARRVGRAVALALAEGGCRVVVHYGRSADDAAATVEAIRGLGAEAQALQADLEAENAPAELMAAAGDLYGGLDVLVNSAASFQRRPFADIAPAEWDHVMAVNLRAPFLLSQHAARLMGRRRGTEEAAGVIVNIADLSGEVPWRGYAHHGVSKAALLHLTRAAALELGPDVRVNAVVPGAILPPPGMEATDESWRGRGRRLPAGRVGDPSAVGRAVRFLVEEDFITGEVLHVDGGEGLLSGRP